MLLSQLKDHMTKHINEYTCKVCHKSFGRKDILSRHEKIHTGDRPYACTYCNFRFTQPGDLNRHIKTVHTDILNEQPYLCKHCDYRTSQSYNLKAHMTSKHPDILTKHHHEVQEFHQERPAFQENSATAVRLPEPAAPQIGRTMGIM